MPPALFFFLLLFQRKTTLCFCKPLFLSLLFALYLVLLPQKLQGLLGFCPDPGLLCLLSCFTGSALRIVCHMTGLDLYSRTEFQLIIVLKDILQNRIVFRFRSKSHLADGQLTRQLIQDQTIQALRDKVSDKDKEILVAQLAASQVAQTTQLENYIDTKLAATTPAA